MKLFYTLFISLIFFPLILHAEKSNLILPTPQNRLTFSPTNQLCMGNHDGGPKSIYGALCMEAKTASKNNHDLETYAMQVEIKSGDYPPHAAGNIDNDIVAAYFATRLYAFSGGGWGINALVHAYPDSGGAIGAEIDVNNFSGCDTAGVYTQTTGGTNPFIANRSDGSACPQKVGLLVTGVANRIMGPAIDVSAVSNEHGMAWQNGLTIIGGYVIAESEFSTNTLARANWDIHGNHERGLDASHATYTQSAIILNANDPTSSRILWRCAEKCKYKDYKDQKNFIGINNQGEMHISSDKFVNIDNLKENISDHEVPMSSSQACQKGQQLFGSPNGGKTYYHYICIAENKWVRSRAYQSF